MKIAFCVSALALFSFRAVSQRVIYSIDFQTPDQMADQLVRTGAASDHVTTIQFGSPRVVTGFGALAEQPLLFSSVGQSPSPFGYFYTQIGLSMAGIQASILDVSFDFIDLGAGHFFTITFDTPIVRKFDFVQGQISFENPTLPIVPIGSYQMGNPHHFSIRIDYDLNQWTFTKDHTFLADGSFDPETDQLRSIRFNYSAADTGISGTAIDNLAVVIVPEPTSLLFWGFAALGLSRRIRRTATWVMVDQTGRMQCRDRIG